MLGMWQIRKGGHCRTCVERRKRVRCDWYKATSGSSRYLARQQKLTVVQMVTIHTDDTVMPMLAPGQTRQARLWVYVGDDPQIVEEWKWRGVPVWSHDGFVCTGTTYKQVVKLTFAKGAKLNDPDGLFNASLDGNTRRAIDIREGEKVNQAALRALVREAVALNSATKKNR